MSALHPVGLSETRNPLSGETITEMVAMASALMPSLSWDAPGWELEIEMENERQQGAATGVSDHQLRAFLGAVLPKVWEVMLKSSCNR